MSVFVTWDEVLPNALLYQFTGEWDIKEFETIIETAFAMISSVDQVIYNIVDFTNSENLPVNIQNTMTQIHQRKAIPKNTGTTIIVGGGMLIKTVLGKFNQTFPQKALWFELADTLEEARFHIAMLPAS